MVKRDDKWFSKTPKWFSATAVGLRRNRQKYKSEMDKSSLKWNSLCGVLRHNPTIFIVFRRPLVVVSSS